MAVFNIRLTDEVHLPRQLQQQGQISSHHALSELYAVLRVRNAQVPTETS